MDAKDDRLILQRIAENVAAQALEAGADAVEVLTASGAELSVRVRKGEAELVQEAASKGLGLRVFRDHRSAVTYTSDFTGPALHAFIIDTVGLCQLSEPDELNELPEQPEQEEGKRPPLDLHLWDANTLTVTTKEAMSRAKAAEAAAFAFSDKVTNSKGATYDRGHGARAFCSADKTGISFSGTSRGTYQSLSVEAICDDADGKKRNASYWTGDRYLDKLLEPGAVGKEAARRAVAKLGAGKIDTQELPVVFSPDGGRPLLGLLFSVVSGGAIYRKSSYLCGREGSIVASPKVSVMDYPLIERGPGSRVFDGEGLAARVNAVIEKGVLRTYLLDNYSARKLGRRSNACAGRSIGGAPHVSTSNFIMQPGPIKPEKLLEGITRGLYVTEMMGFGFNPTTGDFSRGAGGFLIENGELTRPVSEVTISANFDDLLKGIDAVGNDQDRRSSTMNPSFRVTKMTLAGR